MLLWRAVVFLLDEMLGGFGLAYTGCAFEVVLIKPPSEALPARR
jgi:hypothetical protein